MGLGEMVLGEMVLGEMVLGDMDIHPSNQWDFNWADQIGLNNPATGNRPI
jgi:hypothetical protein